MSLRARTTLRALRRLQRAASTTHALPNPLGIAPCLCHLPSRRNYRPTLTPLQSYEAGTLSVDDYHDVADHTMEALLDFFEALIEDHADDLRGSDVEYSSGVLTIRLGEDSYVINKQPPNKQIWLSSPFTGPKRYDYDPKAQKWFYSRNQESIQDLLSNELTQALHKDIKVVL